MIFREKMLNLEHEKVEKIFAKRDQATGRRIQSVVSSKRFSVLKGKYFREEKFTRSVAGWSIFAGLVASVATQFVSAQIWANFSALQNAVGFADFFTWLVIIFSGVILLKHPLSPAGAEMKNYLLGLKMFITVAEADRIKFLQSAKTVQLDDAHVAEIYEKLLPAAIFFAKEKTWGKALETRVGTDAPSWYAGANFATFTSGIGGFSSGISGSFGGGASGGGAGGAGGGGGGGGW